MTEYPGRDERRLAEMLVDRVVERAPELLDLEGIPLRSTLEQALFAGLRSGRLPAVRPLMDRSGPWSVRSLGRLAQAAIRNRTVRSRGDGGGVLVCIHAPVHAVVFAPVATELAAGGFGPIHVLTLKPLRSEDLPTLAGLASTTPLFRHFERRWIRPLLAHARATNARIGHAAVDWSAVAGPQAPGLQRLAAFGLVRGGLLAAGLDSALRRMSPALLVAFDESGPWARLAPAAARHIGIPSLDLPHAEAADPWGSVGMEYDTVAVYGPRAAEVMALAGLPPSRVVQTGAPRFDRLIAATRIAPPSGGRSIVFASQPADPGRPALHPRIKDAAIRATIAAAGAVAPADVVVRPHPTETDTVAEETIASSPLPEGVTIRIERARDLHDLLTEAWLLVTASSQSVFDAAAAGVPAMTVHPTGSDAPVSFAAEGISLGVTDEASAAEATRRLQDDAWRKTVVSAARAAVEARLGPLDGHASERTAELIRVVAAGRSPGLERAAGS